MNLTQKDRKIIQELSKTSYDAWIIPPPMDTLEHILKSEPKNYATVSMDQLVPEVIKNLSCFEPLINKLSEKNLNQLNRTLRHAFHGDNFIDVEYGGLGLTIPTFMEIMARYVFWIRHDNCSKLVTKEDKEFYNKYFWCFEQHSLLTYNQMNKAS